MRASCAFCSSFFFCPSQHSCSSGLFSSVLTYRTPVLFPAGNFTAVGLQLIVISVCCCVLCLCVSLYNCLCFRLSSRFRFRLGFRFCFPVSAPVFVIICQLPEHFLRRRGDGFIFSFQCGGKIFDPSIASVDQCFDEMGAAAIRLWKKQTDEGLQEITEMVPCKFVPGESCNCYKYRDSDKSISMLKARQAIEYIVKFISYTIQQ